jgi:hypothetical protein
VAGLALSFATASSFANQNEDLRVGIDGDPAGNSATSLGDVQDCRQVDVNEEFQVDVFIAGVTDLDAYQYFLYYDPAILTVLGADATGDDTILGSGEGGPVADFTQIEGLPGVEGDFGGAAATFGDPVSGEGVLTRIDMRAIAAGQSELRLDTVTVTTPTPQVGTVINPGPDGKHFRGPILNAAISVGAACEPPVQPTEAPAFSPTAGPSPTGDGDGTNGGETGGPTGDDGSATPGTASGSASPTEAGGNGDNDDDGEDGGSSTTWIVIALIVVAVAAGGGGAYVWWRRRQAA